MYVYEAGCVVVYPNVGIFLHYCRILSTGRPSETALLWTAFRLQRALWLFQCWYSSSAIGAQANGGMFLASSP